MGTFRIISMSVFDGHWQCIRVAGVQEFLEGIDKEKVGVKQEQKPRYFFKVSGNEFRFSNGVLIRNCPIGKRFEDFVGKEACMSTVEVDGGRMVKTCVFSNLKHAVVQR